MEDRLKAVAAEVFNYGEYVSIRVENGPLLPHVDKRFPQERLRIIRLNREDLEWLAERQAAAYTEKQRELVNGR